MRATSVALLLAACLALGAAQATQGHDSWDPIELEPVAPTRSLLAEAGSYASGGYGGGYGSSGYGYGGGAYGGHRRRLIAAGGYGGYGYGSEYGYGSPRLLMEADEAQQEQQQQEQQRLASAGAAAERRAEQQREAAAGEAGAAAAAAAPSAAVAVALRGARAAAAAGALSVPAGQCYCRYDSDYNTWALGEDACKTALAAKCKAGQLPCAWLDAYYGHPTGGAMAHTLPHEQDILGFVFDDCQPHPPCACAGVKFDGSDAVTNSFACCRDLRAACRTPFNGLSCADVEAFCRDDAPSTKLLHWAQHKLHRGAECGAYAGTPYEFRTLESIVAANQEPEVTAADETAEMMIEAAATIAAAGRAGAGAARGFGNNKVATAVVGLGGLLVGVAIVGMVMTLRGDGGDGRDARGDAAAPLLHPVPEVAHRGEQHPALRHVISSNYILASAPPSRSASDASIQPQQH